ncbi:MAG: serine hydrolase domain-containing protein [Devosia sp.]
MTMTARVDAAIDAALGSRIVGCVVLINREGERVYARAAGLADREAGASVVEDTIFRLASCTKPIVATAVLVLADMGLLSVDDPVTKYLPFLVPTAPDGSTPVITIRQLLTHTSGITYDSPPHDVQRGAGPGPSLSLEENLRRLGRGSLAFAPGARWEYGMSIDVLGGVVGAINGKISDVEAALTRWVTGPLGMIDTHFFVRDPARLATAYGDATPAPFRMGEPQTVYNDPANPDKAEVFSPGRIMDAGAPQSGGAGMAGTASDFMKLLECWRSGDLLTPASRQSALSNQIGPLFRPNDPGQQFGFVGAVIADAKASGWQRAGMVQWGGIWGNNWIVDPVTDTNIVVFTNTMREGCNGPFREEIRDAVFGDG